MTISSKIAAILTAIITVFSLFLGPIPPANAINACNSRESYDSTDCTFMYYDINPNPEAFYSCKDQWGYVGNDRFVALTFASPGNGLLVRGSDLRFTLELNQDCRAWVDAYKVSVTLVADSGETYASENHVGDFTYRNRLSAPTLSYCSTSTCGSASIEGMIRVPASAPNGKYKIKVRISPWGATTTTQNQTLLMNGFLSTTPQARFLPSISKLTAAAALEGQISCSFADFVDSAIASFSILGSDWEIYEDGVLVDKYVNFPIAKSDNLNVLPLKHGYLMSTFLESTGARMYAYGVANQKIGSTYECRVAVNTSFGSGPFVKASAKSTVQTQGIDVIAKATPPSTPKATTIYCKKGKVVKTIKSLTKKCPSGYVKVKTAKG